MPGLFIQLFIFFQQAHGESASGGSIQLVQSASRVLKTTLVALSNQVILPSLLGQRHAYSLATKGYWFTGPLVLAGFLIFIVAAGWSLSREDQWKLAAGVWFMAGSVALSMATRPGVRGLLPDFSHAIRFGADRYFFCGCCFFSYCLALTAGRWIGHGSRIRPALFAGIFLLSVIVNFHIGPLKNLRWNAYASEIDHWSRCKRTGQACPVVSVPVSPEPWQIELPALSADVQTRRSNSRI